MNKIFTKIKDYFTANTCRKIFFFGLLFALLIFLINYFVGLWALRTLGAMACVVALVASLVDSMQSYRAFTRQVKQMQYDHLQEIFDQQEAGQDVPLTPTFSPAEKKYIKHKKWTQIGFIVMKLIFAISLFFLLFS